MGGGGFLGDEADGGLDSPSQQESRSEFLAVKTQVRIGFLQTPPPPKKKKTAVCYFIQHQQPPCVSAQHKIR